MTWTIEYIDGPLAGEREHVEAAERPQRIERVDANVWFRYRVEPSPRSATALCAYFEEQREGPPVPDDRGATEPLDQRLTLAEGGQRDDVEPRVPPSGIVAKKINKPRPPR